MPGRMWSMDSSARIVQERAPRRVGLTPLQRAFSWAVLWDAHGLTWPRVGARVDVPRLDLPADDEVPPAVLVVRSFHELANGSR
ncbi:MAG: hypothetical protein ACLPY3_17565, partial [Solirubrobacteraceae bacterium]